jgi:hypothetical protein
LLVHFIVLVEDLNVLVFIIKSTCNIQDLSFLVDDVLTVSLEELPPS